MPRRRLPVRALAFVAAILALVLALFDLTRPTSVLRELYRGDSPPTGMERLRDDLRDGLRERGPTRPLPPSR